MTRLGRPYVGLIALAVIILQACSNSPAVSTAASSPAASSAPSVQASAPAAATSTPAPSQAAGTASAATGATLTAGLFQNFDSFYPWDEAGNAGSELARELQWDFLAAYDETGTPQMRLAESITASSDAKTWTVKLRQGVSWSDGKPFSSADVVFSWKVGANPNQSYNSAVWSGVVGMTDWQKGPDYSKDIPGITAPDDHTVVFQLTEPNAAFESSLLNIRNSILPSAQLLAAVPNIFSLDQKGIWALPFWTAPSVAIGPYIWQQTQPGGILSFAPNPNWYGTKPSFTEVVLKNIQQLPVAAAQVQSGDVDFAVVTKKDLAGLKAAGLQTATVPTPSAILSDYNTSAASPFHDVRVRQAFMYACDRQGFVDTFLLGQGLKIDTHFFPSWVPKDGIRVYGFDLQKAKALLDEANFDYSKPVRWMSWNKDAPDRQAFLVDCQSKLKSIGVNVEIINGLEVHNQRMPKGDWDLDLHGGYAVQDPDQIRLFLSCSAIGTIKNANGFLGGGTNTGDYCNPKFDSLMDQASKVADQTQRAALYKQAQDIYLADVPLAVHYIDSTAYAWSAELQGVVPFGDASQTFLKIDQWAKKP